MKPLKLDEIRHVLPALDELRPVLDFLMTRSTPDPERTWSRAGEVDTVGQRLVPSGAFAASAEELARREQEHLQAVYQCVGQALAYLGGEDKTSAAQAFLEAGALEEERDRPERAEAYASAAYHTSRDERDQRLAALALRRWARAARTQGRLEDARSRYVEAFRISRAIFDRRGGAEAAIGAGNSLEEQGRWPEAEEWYRNALETLEDLDDPIPERWQAMLNLHITLRSRGEIDKSLPWLRDAEEAAEASGDHGAAPFVQNAWGQLHLFTGEFGEAEAHLRRALDASESVAATVTIRLNLAEALLAQERSIEAAEEARQAEREALVGGLVPRLPEVYRILGRIAAKEGNPDAFTLFERALEIIRERGLPILEEARTLQAYAQAEAQRGEEDTARQLHERAGEKYRALGLDHMRHPWTDVHGPQPTESGGRPPADEGEDHA